MLLRYWLARKSISCILHDPCISHDILYNTRPHKHFPLKFYRVERKGVMMMMITAVILRHASPKCDKIAVLKMIFQFE